MTTRMTMKVMASLTLLMLLMDFTLVASYAFQPRACSSLTASSTLSSRSMSVQRRADLSTCLYSSRQQPRQLQQQVPSSLSTTTILLDEWKILANGRIEGKVVNHPELQDGSTISTSGVVQTQEHAQNTFFFPLPSITGQKQRQQEQPLLRENMIIQTYSGSRYQLLRPAANMKNEVGTPGGRGIVEEQEDEVSETKKLMRKVKDAGIAGVISYAFWELGFWTVSVPVCIFAYRQIAGHWPDFSNPDDLKQLGAEAFAFVNVARFAVPLRIGLALSTTPWTQKNIVDRFTSKRIDNIQQ